MAAWNLLQKRFLEDIKKENIQLCMLERRKS